MGLFKMGLFKMGLFKMGLFKMGLSFENFSLWLQSYCRYASSESG
jgi:hypothetical protein